MTVDIDPVQLHSVVQGFFVETLEAESTLPFWLSRAITIFCSSYDAANKKVDGKTNVGLVEDYRLYEIHGKTLQRHVVKYQARRIPDKFNSEGSFLLEAAELRLQQTIIDITQQLEYRTIVISNLIAGAGPTTSRPLCLTEGVAQ